MVTTDGKTIAKEVAKVYLAFDIKDMGTKPPIGHSYIGVHMIFDIKMENFQFKVRLICQALNGTKSVGAAFRNHSADCMLLLDYESCKADPDVWMKQFTKPCDTRYYGYTLLYVDNALCLNHNAQ